jgi:hypothetical protein
MELLFLIKKHRSILSKVTAQLPAHPHHPATLLQQTLHDLFYEDVKQGNASLFLLKKMKCLISSSNKN